MDDMSYNFLKYNLNQINHLGALYDTCSVMHYGAFAFSKVLKIKSLRLVSYKFCTRCAVLYPGTYLVSYSGMKFFIRSQSYDLFSNI
jgi:hypothetical protein